METLKRFNFNQSIPLLFLGDAPDSLSGLGRIGHDLAWLASSLPEFQVGYLGRGAFGRSVYPWTQYSFSEEEQWGEGAIERAWTDLAGDRKGIIFTLWDASRLLWFADGKGTGLERFLKSGRFERWGYFMADAAGVCPDTLPLAQAHVVSQYQRAVFASRWAKTLTRGITGPEIDWIPHPINRETFHPRGRAEIRSAWRIREDQYLIGCVMTNQQRKHWPVVLETMARLAGLGDEAALWAHTDTIRRYWDLEALAVEYGLEHVILETAQLRDSEMAARYSACDATLVISGGEGFCYPVAESLSCGVPCVTGDYGAQAELTAWKVAPAITGIDTLHNVRRAAYCATDVAHKLIDVLGDAPSPRYCEGLVRHLNAKELGIVWKKWFRGGLV